MMGSAKPIPIFFSPRMAVLIPIIIVLIVFLPQAMRVLREYERGVIFRLGKLEGAKGPGLIILIPLVDKMVRMDLRVVTIDVAKQEVMTRDNVRAYLNTWIADYVLVNDNAPQEIKAQYPLREARVDVTEVAGKPGAYRATVFLRPHFQLEELTASIRLVATLPPPAAA